MEQKGIGSIVFLKFLVLQWIRCDASHYMFDQIQK